MEVTGPGLGKIPLLPINNEDLKALADVLAGYLAYVKVVRLLAKDEGSFLFSVEELRALKEAAHGFMTLMTRVVPLLGERDEVIEHLQALVQQFAEMLSPLVN
jgi:hypothetical protein